MQGSYLKVMNPNAWIRIREEELEPFKESKKTDDEAIIKDDKYSKFDKWLLS